MKVILKKDILNLGRSGEIKTVKDGYARNFLMPRGMVELATVGALKAWKNSRTISTWKPFPKMIFGSSA